MARKETWSMAFPRLVFLARPTGIEAVGGVLWLTCSIGASIGLLLSGAAIRGAVRPVKLDLILMSMSASAFVLPIVFDKKCLFARSKESACNGGVPSVQIFRHQWSPIEQAGLLLSVIAIMAALNLSPSSSPSPVALVMLSIGHLFSLTVLVWRATGIVLNIGSDGLLLRTPWRARFIPYRAVSEPRLNEAGGVAALSLGGAVLSPFEPATHARSLAMWSEAFCARYRSARAAVPENDALSVALGFRANASTFDDPSKLSIFRTLQLPEERLWAIAEDSGIQQSVRVAALMMIRANDGVSLETRARGILSPGVLAAFQEAVSQTKTGTGRV